MMRVFVDLSLHNGFEIKEHLFTDQIKFHTLAFDKTLINNFEL